LGRGGICEGKGHWVLKEKRKRRVLEGILTYYGRGTISFRREREYKAFR
jgi:hypothetical protein